MAKGRKYKPIGLLKKVYLESTNPKKDELVNELIEKLKVPIQEPTNG